MLSNREILTQVYIAYYNRAPDPIGFQFWIDLFDGGLPLLDIARDFATQSETYSVYPFLFPDVQDGGDAANDADTQPSLETEIQSFLGEVYDNLFNRVPDDAGLNFWTDVILAGVMPVGDVVLEIIAGAQEIDTITLGNKVDVALHWLDCAQDDPNYVQSQAATDASRAALDVVTDARSTFFFGRSENEEFFGKDEEEEAPLNTTVPVVADGFLTSTEVLLNQSVIGNQRSPDVTTLEDGNLVYVWTDESRDVTFFRIFGPDGVAITDQMIGISSFGTFIDQFDPNPNIFVVNETRNDPQVVALPDGGFVISTRSLLFLAPQITDFGEGSVIFGRQFAANGDVESDVFAANRDTDLPEPILDAAEYDVTVNQDGNLLYVWEGFDESPLGGFSRDSGIPFARVLEPDGSLESDIVQLREDNATLGNEVENSEVTAATLSNGNYAAVWTQELFAGPGERGDLIFVSLLDNDGDEEVAPIKITPSVQGIVEDPQVVPLDGGGFMLSWLVRETINGGADRYSIHAQNFDEDAEAVGAEVTIIDFGTPLTEDFNAVGLQNGNIVMAWQTNVDIFAVIVDVDGMIVEPPFQLDAAQGSGIGTPLPVDEFSLVATQNGGFSISFGVNSAFEMGDVFGTAAVAKFFDENGEVYEVNRVLPEGAVRFLSDEQLIDLGGFAFDANGAEVIAVDAMSTLGATLLLQPNGFIQYTTSTSQTATDLEEGEQVIDTFGYTVENLNNPGEEVDLVGSIVYQGFDLLGA